MFNFSRPNRPAEHSHNTGTTPMRRNSLRHAPLLASLILPALMFGQDPVERTTLLIEAVPGGADKAYVELEGTWADDPGKGAAEGLTAASSRKVIAESGKINGVAVFRPNVPSPGFYRIQVCHTPSANAKGVAFALEGIARSPLPTVDFIPAGSPDSKAGTWITLSETILLPQGNETTLTVDARKSTGPADETKPFEFGITAVRFLPTTSGAITGQNPYAGPRETPAPGLELPPGSPPVPPPSSVLPTPVATMAAPPAATPAAAQSDVPMVADPFSADVRGSMPPPDPKDSKPSAAPVDPAALPLDPFAAPATEVIGQATPPKANPPIIIREDGSSSPGQANTVKDPFAASGAPPTSGVADPFSTGAPPTTPRTDVVVLANPTSAPASGPVSPGSSAPVAENPFEPTPALSIIPEDDRIRIENPSAPSRGQVVAQGANPYFEGTAGTNSPTPPKQIVLEAKEEPVVLPFTPEKSLSAALSKAKSSSKPVVIVFASPTAAYRGFEREILANDDAGKAFAGAVPVILDLRKDRETARKYAVKSAPYTVVLDSTGHTRAHVAERRSRRAYLDAVTKAMQ